MAMGFLCNYDQKQHINLSKESWEQIDSDCISFSSSIQPISLATFLNTIITNFYEAAHCSISNRMQAHKNNITNALLNTPLNKDSGLLKKVSSSLLENYLEEMRSDFTKYPKGEGRKFRLSNTNYELLTSINEDQYYSSLGSFLKALFEEYAHKTYVEREKIFFKEVVDKINFAIEKKCTLSIKTYSSDNKTHISPFCIKQDRSNNFNYLIGAVISENWDLTTSVKPLSIRISRIESIKPLISEHSIINKNLKEQLEEETIKTDVAFVSDNLVDVTIRFTELGLKKYVTYIRQRPNITKILNEQERIYEFKCPYTQALYYFFKFGEDAEVIEPERLRKKITTMLENSLQKYK